jgi:hypothetical protein
MHFLCLILISLRKIQEGIRKLVTLHVLFIVGQDVPLTLVLGQDVPITLVLGQDVPLTLIGTECTLHQFWDRMYLTLILDRIDLTLILGQDVTYTNSGTGCTHNTNSGTGCALNTNWIECTLHQFWDRMYLTLILG